MNAADNGGGNAQSFPALFAEIAELKRQRDELQTALAQCRHLLREAGIDGGDE